MSMIMRDEEHDDFASGSHNNDSDDDRSSTESGTHEFAGGQEFIAIDNSELSERAAGEYLSPVVPIMRDPATQGFENFIRSTKKLERHFKKCGYTVQRLGSALALSRTSLEFYRALRKVRIHFQEHNRLARFRGSMPSMSNGSTAFVEEFEDIDLLEYLQKLYDGLGEFIIAIVEFNDYYADEDGADALHNFRREIRLLHESLDFFGKDGENTKELQRYVLSRAISLREHIDAMSDGMKRFIENGIPCISYAQKRFAKVLANASTVATFFSGVAATTLQYSSMNTKTPIGRATNTLWLSALVLSIGSAISGLLTMTWRQAVYSSPSRSLPSPFRFWMRHGYLLLLAAAVFTYGAGLLTYVFSFQSRVTAWIILALVIFCDLSVISITAWYSWEKWNFVSIQRQRYLNMQWAVNWVKRALADVHHKGASAIHKDRSSAPLSAHQDHSAYEMPTGDDNRRARLRVHLPRQGSRVFSHTGGHRPTFLHQTTMLIQKSTNEQIGAIKSLAPVDIQDKEVRHMQFSPCGSWFVACYKKTSRIYNVENGVQLHQEMTHHGGNAQQVEWALHGDRFLTRYKHGVNLWELKEDRFNLCQTFKLPNLSLIQWLNDDEFLALTDFGDSLLRINVNDGGRKCYNLPRDLQIHEMCAVSGKDYDRVIFVASRPLGLPGDTLKGIDCIIVFSMNDNVVDENPHPFSQSKKYGLNWRIERRIPLTDHIMSLRACRDRHHMLISYERKAPEVWILGEELRTLSMNHVLSLPASDSTVERVNGSSLRRRLNGLERKHVLWGEPFFLGEAQNIVACAANGDMHFWRLDDFQHFQHFHQLHVASMGELIDGQPIYCFNDALPRNAIMATAAAAGTLKIWGSNVADRTINHRTSTPSSQSLGAIPEQYVQ